MKFLISTLGLIFFILSVQLKAFAQIYYPSASFFNPTASLFRGSNKNVTKWLELHGASVFASLITDNNLESELNNKEQTITVIAPIDEAFNNLSTEDADRLSNSEEVNKLFKYHLIPGIISEEDIINQQITTSDGNTISITGKILEDQSQVILLNDSSRIQKIEKINENLIVVLTDGVLIPQNQNCQ